MGLDLAALDEVGAGISASSLVELFAQDGHGLGAMRCGAVSCSGSSPGQGQKSRVVSASRIRACASCSASR